MSPNPSELCDICPWDLPPVVVQQTLAELCGVDNGPEADRERRVFSLLNELFVIEYMLIYRAVWSRWRTVPDASRLVSTISHMLH